MKYVVTAAEMQSADKAASEKLGLPSVVLMERAALAVADEIVKYADSYAAKRALKVCIACGSGNNGGDGFALGRILNERGFIVHFFMAQEAQKPSEANRLQREILKNLGHTVSTGQPAEEYDIVVDSIFGTGLHREITGAYQTLIEKLNHMKGWKVAVDIPSGVNSDNGTILGCAFQADLTVAFAFKKWGHLLYPGKGFCGRVVCKDIGIPETVLSEKMPIGQMLERQDITGILPARIPDSHKGNYGKAGVIAGSKQMGGAVILCSQAAMRMGVGYTKVMTAEENRDVLLSMLPEALIYTYQAETYAMTALADCQAIAVGPGIGTGQDAERVLEAVLEQTDCSLILDADAINILAKRTDFREKLREYAKRVDAQGKCVILTPHKKEFCRLTNLSMQAGADEWNRMALQTAADLSSVVVLKDAVTRIYTPEGRIYVNTTGNPGMSTAGSGDVLTGIICGLAAQMQNGRMAAVLGVYLHGLCGDYAVAQSNVYAMTAMDIAEALKYVLKGETWQNAEDKSL